MKQANAQEQDHKEILWIGAGHAGLNRMDSKTGGFMHYRYAENDPNSLSFDQVRIMYDVNYN